MKLLIAIILSCFSFVGFSQNTPAEHDIAVPLTRPENDKLTVVNNEVSIGNPSEYVTVTGKRITQFLAENFNYPDEAIENGVSGTIYVQFIAEKDGSVSDIAIIKSLCKQCDEEALRVIKKLRLKPINVEGKPERVRLRVPISLVLME